MSSNIPAKIREDVEKRAKYVCEYCLMPQIDAHYIHHIDYRVSTAAERFLKI